ncbi:MAG: transporter substrate-binding domain-containing protein [Ilumatobacteraceae bacterium]
MITYAQRLPALEAREVDLVAHTMTINCNRWLRIAFSSVYYQAGQKVLVKTGSGSTRSPISTPPAPGVCARGQHQHRRDPRHREVSGVGRGGQARHHRLPRRDATG